MKIDNKLPQSAIALQSADPRIADLAEVAAPVMAWGACTAPLCGCQGYVSDSAHDGHCVCGHTAASHGDQ